MADFKLFTEGANKVLDSGLPKATKLAFALSTKTADELVATLKGTEGGSAFGEITGTGYARQEQEPPNAASQKKSFAEMEWKTGVATDWPAGTKSVVCFSGTTAICGWNLQPGGAARDMSGANTTEKFTPIFQLS
jgi:hypothetical protein